RRKYLCITAWVFCIYNPNGTKIGFAYTEIYNHTSAFSIFLPEKKQYYLKKACSFTANRLLR
ncbi:MAG TPA: hypothetical protein VL490_04750, partial [Mucilaginibacter sp.]|nr:hypothetical protein [Mucilaginibacter sp.]